MSKDLYAELRAVLHAGAQGDPAERLCVYLAEHYGGQRVYIPQRTHDPQAIASSWTGRDAAALARRMGVSTRTVYRAIKRRA